ncbi:hypothetical protein [Myroides sp.]|uniref:hypothetical protein n=1 Tax=Myroides sp. TaxID=1874736 RepID=UPI003F3D1D04
MEENRFTYEVYNTLSDLDKVEFITDLEWEEDDSKWELYNIILCDESDFDLARIKVLKIIEVTPMPILLKKQAFR